MALGAKTELKQYRRIVSTVLAYYSELDCRAPSKAVYISHTF